LPEEITLNKELGIIEVLSHGKVTGKDCSRSLALLKELIRTSGVHKVLSDTRKQKSTPSTMDIFNFGVSLPTSIKLAVIVSESQPTLNDVAFVDNVAHNRGVNIKKFTSRSEALEWLQD
jgi:hypothetical protein